MGKNNYGIYQPGISIGGSDNISSEIRVLRIVRWASETMSKGLLMFQAAASYTFCGVKYARPVNLCLRCKEDYLRVINVYADLGKSSQVTTL